jgi:HEAT repeat protein
MDRESILIDVLKDRSADISERDDAAMDLGVIGTEHAFYDLVDVASDSNESEVILQSCGESIAEIYCRIANKLKTKADQKLPISSIAYDEAVGFLSAERPDYLQSFTELFLKKGP